MQLRQVTADFKQLIDKLEQDRPGWHWEDSKGFVADDAA